MTKASNNRIFASSFHICKKEKIMAVFRSLSTLLVWLGLAVSSVWAEPVRYDADLKGVNTLIQFKVQKFGLNWLTGRFDRFDAHFVYDDDNLANSQVAIEIETASVNSSYDSLDKVLRDESFLNVERFPSATFVSTEVLGTKEKMQILGTLTLNGVAKSITIDAVKQESQVKPLNQDRAEFRGSTILKLTDFNITENLGVISPYIQLDFQVEGQRGD